MSWRLIAETFGWRMVADEDAPALLLIVRHPLLRRHFTGPDAWKAAVRLSIRAPQPYPADAKTQEVRP